MVAALDLLLVVGQEVLFQKGDVYRQRQFVLAGTVMAAEGVPDDRLPIIPDRLEMTQHVHDGLLDDRVVVLRTRIVLALHGRNFRGSANVDVFDALDDNRVVGIGQLEHSQYRVIELVEVPAYRVNSATIRHAHLANKETRSRSSSVKPSCHRLIPEPLLSRRWA